MEESSNTKIQDKVKETLYNDKEKIIFILEELGCHKISSSRDEIRCALPDGSNPTSIAILITESIPCYIYSRGEYGDIFDLVKYIKEVNFPSALKWLCAILKIPYEDYEVTETMAIVRELRKEKRIRNKEIKIKKRQILPDSTMHKYKLCVVEEWIKEGLSPQSQKKYEILKDNQNHCWLIPIRDEEGRLINFKRRTYAPNWKEIGIPKYTYYYKLGVNDVLFGLDKNKEKIKECNEMILFEAEKSVIAADSYGYDWGCSVSTNSINKYLIKKILKLRCSQVVLAFDKDVKWKDILKEARKLTRYINVYIIYDKKGLLKEKESPTDNGREVFDLLYKTRIKVK